MKRFLIATLEKATPKGQPPLIADLEIVPIDDKYYVSIDQIAFMTNVSSNVSIKGDNVKINTYPIYCD